MFWFEVPIILKHETDGVACTADKKLQAMSIPKMEGTSSARFGEARPEAEPQSVTRATLSCAQQSDTPVPVRDLLAMHNIDPARIEVLLVEDEKMLLSFLKKSLERIGFRVDGACDGMEGLYCMQRKAYDVVLMDKSMPHLDGLEAVRLFRKWQASANPSMGAATPPLNQDGQQLNDPLIFMVSASILESDCLEAMDLHIAQYLEKPLRVNTIATAVVMRILSHPRLLRKCQRNSLSPRGSHQNQAPANH